LKPWYSSKGNISITGKNFQAKSGCGGSKNGFVSLDGGISLGNVQNHSPFTSASAFVVVSVESPVIVHVVRSAFQFVLS